MSGSYVTVSVTADMYYGHPPYQDPELKAWRYNIVPKEKERQVFARICPDTDLDLSEVEAIARILEANHPGRKIYVEADGTVVSVPSEGAGTRRVSLAFVTAMAEARASKPQGEDTEYYLTIEMPKSKMCFSDLDSGILRYLRLIRPDYSIWMDGWEVLGTERRVEDGGPTPTSTGRYGKENVPKVHILSDAEYIQLMNAQYDRGFAEGWDAHYAKVVE